MLPESEFSSFTFTFVLENKATKDYDAMPLFQLMHLRDRQSVNDIFRVFGYDATFDLGWIISLVPR
jgi:hypothetical protein